MNIQLLIDAVVRQTTVLIAQLATAGGTRAPLAHVANQVFLDLVQELEQQGISKKVGADMFGQSLRTYQRKIQRLAESNTDRGRSLWEAIFAYLEERKITNRTQVFARFHQDDEQLVRGVLHDLAESGLIFSSGTGRATAYRAVTSEELSDLRSVEEGSQPAAAQDAFLWAMVYRNGPIAQDELGKRVQLPAAQLAATLERLVGAGRVERDTRGCYRCSELTVPYGSTVGWEAAVFDHFQALVRTVCQRLQMAEAPHLKDWVGGSTYTFVVWNEHPMLDEVQGTLARFRQASDDLRTRVDAYNAASGIPLRHRKVVTYAGQSLIDEETDE